MELPNTADIVVIGGGVMGASTAYHLLVAGQKNVLLLEKDEFFGQGATGRCAGGVRYQFSTDINIRLSIQSLSMLEHFKEEHDQEIDFRKYGYLFALTRPQDIEYFHRNVDLQHSLNIHTDFLSGEEVRRRLPLMDFHDALGGTFNPNEGIVDPNSVVMGYIKSGQRYGLKAINSCEVIGIEVESGSIKTVITNQGAISTPIVVNATGPWSGLIGKMAGVDIPITPVRRQLLTTTPIPELPNDFPFVIDFAQSLYFHREGRGLLTGMSNNSEKPGFDQTIDPDFEMVNLKAAMTRMPLLEKVGLVSHWAGLYEITPDAHPIFGETPVHGFYIVGGFSGHGFMHGPVAGKLMAEIILEGKYSTLDVSSLDLARFEAGRPIQEYNVV